MASVIIQGSARKDGNTSIAGRYLQQHTNSEIIDLLDLKFSGYDYQHRNKDDDFLPSMKQLVSQCDTFYFLTPVYWYTMSGPMKNFLDRLTDCVTIEKEIGSQMKGKNLGLISMGSEEAVNPHFDEPFRLTAGYLYMEYLGHCHTWCENETLAPKAKEAIKTLARKTA